MLMPNIPSVVCQADKTWSNEVVPRCEKSTCSNIDVIGGQTTGACTPGEYGKYCHVSCKKGYKLSGKKSVLCSFGGKWNANKPTCLKSETFMFIDKEIESHQH